MPRTERNYAAIILLIYIYFIFTLIESGKSTTSRYFFEAFASIFKMSELGRSDIPFNGDTSLNFLKVVLSWFDTISAIASTDCRAPFCEESWFIPVYVDFSTLDLMGVLMWVY